jgi:branched-chain amino acid transport system permease protein
MTYWTIQLLNGLSFAAILFILSSGFTLAFGLMKTINLAHGSFYMLGAYIAMSALAWFGSFVAAVLMAALMVMVIGSLSEEFLLRRLHLRPLPQVLLTIGMALVIAELSIILWEGESKVMAPPAFLAGAAKMGDIYYPKYRLFVIGLGISIALMLWLVQEKTRIGAIIRACVDDEEMAQAMRINTRLLFFVMFGVAAFLAGLGGAVGAPYVGAFPGVDFEVLPLALVVVIVGGLGSLGGAVLGSILVGVLDSLGKALFPELSYFTLFAPMILILAFRPTGLMGRG